MSSNNETNRRPFSNQAPSPNGQGGGRPLPKFNVPSGGAFQMGTSEPAREPAGFGIRWIAAILDGIIAGIASFPIQIVIGLIFTMSASGQPTLSKTEALVINQVLFIAFYAFYYIWFYKNKGATPGKLICKLQVIDYQTGEFLNAGQTLKREVLGRVVCMFTFMIGYLMVAFRSDKRGLHDLIAGTQVVKSES